MVRSSPRYDLLSINPGQRAIGLKFCALTNRDNGTRPRKAAKADNKRVRRATKREEVGRLLAFL